MHSGTALYHTGQRLMINKKDLDFSVTMYDLMSDGCFFELSYQVNSTSYAADPTSRYLLKTGGENGY